MDLRIHICKIIFVIDHIWYRLFTHCDCFRKLVVNGDFIDIKKSLPNEREGFLCLDYFTGKYPTVAIIF